MGYNFSGHHLGISLDYDHQVEVLSARQSTSSCYGIHLSKFCQFKIQEHQVEGHLLHVKFCFLWSGSEFPASEDRTQLDLAPGLPCGLFPLPSGYFWPCPRAFDRGQVPRPTEEQSVEVLKSLHLLRP